MTTMVDRPVLPPSDPAERVELDELATLLTASPGGAALVAPDGTSVHLPPAVHEVLTQVITAMRAGRAITVAPLAQRLTTQEAADLLGVSRPTLVKLLEDGKIPFEQPGRHRRIRLDDLLAYRDRRRQERGNALDELVRQTETLDLYDDETPGDG
ncbi:helix-turn-helix domain-containing protein [Solihabitans fulvus]|uniref:Helix-turn-helix domain-containing protein n=1 Tax=Solihabitans fulvus TaxID=1892852 RepID=A0A5B2WY62_9PSEU|nr:helix-turn-helix domain-containing protein [Solihabitans fulvus]KAA2255642.1 helix-turn-helix domain-containing protein [Solihabitans fulvus]